jgi:hypothetical protein
LCAGQSEATCSNKKLNEVYAYLAREREREALAADELAFQAELKKMPSQILPICCTASTHKKRNHPWYLGVSVRLVEQ